MHDLQIAEKKIPESTSSEGGLSSWITVAVVALGAAIIYGLYFY